MKPPSPYARRRLGKYALSCLAGCTTLLFFIPIGLATFVGLFYLEEDWRGAHAWAQAKADFEAQGETLEPAKFIPAPVPDAENFGALSYFNVIAVSGENGALPTTRYAISPTLKRITDQMPPLWGDSPSDHKLPFLGNWQKGLSPSVADVSTSLASYLKSQQASAIVPDNASALDLFELACPLIAELRTAAANHSQCMFPDEINFAEPWKQTFGTDTIPLSLYKVLLYDTQLAMWSNRPDVALGDLRVGWRLISGVRKRPFYVSNLVAIGILAMQLRIVDQGLSTQIWDDAQLTELDDELTKLDLLGQSRRQINGEIAIFSLPMIDYYATHRGKWNKDTSQVAAMFEDTDDAKTRAFQATYQLIPRGWFDLAKADEARRKIETLRRIDLKAHEIRPGPDPEKSTDPAIRWLDFILPDTNFLGNMEKHLAYAQAQLDEAQIACRMERYRLAHQAYPATLDELAAGFGSLPHDIIGGGSYHYQLKTPQEYILYSVGWNQVDDHGDAGSKRDWESPDWIWTNYPNQK